MQRRVRGAAEQLSKQSFFALLRKYTDTDTNWLTRGKSMRLNLINGDLEREVKEGHTYDCNIYILHIHILDIWVAGVEEPFRS